MKNLKEGTELIVISLDDLVENFEEVFGLAKRSPDGEVMVLVDGKEGDFVEPLQSETSLLSSDGHESVSKNAPQQSGFSMIELLIAVTIISTTMLAAASLSSISANGLMLVMNKRAAGKQAAALTSKLKSKQSIQLNAVEAFPVAADTGLPLRDNAGNITLNCSSFACDKIVSFPAESTGASPREEAVGWDDRLPDGATVKFIRAWTITDEDVTRSWRRISVVVLTPDSRLPLTSTVTGGIAK